MSESTKYERPQWFPGTPWSVRVAPKVESFLGCGCLIAILVFIAGVLIWMSGAEIGAALFFGSLALGWIVSLLMKAKRKDFKKFQMPDTELLVLDKRAWEAGQSIRALGLGGGIQDTAEKTVDEVRAQLFAGARLEKDHGYSLKLLVVPHTSPDNWQTMWSEISSQMARNVIMLEDLAKPVRSS